MNKIDLEKQIFLKKIEEKDYQRLWEISEKEEDYSWVHFNAPYFHYYKPVSYEQFLAENSEYLLSDRYLGIYLDNVLVGRISYHWENQDTRWLEIGIILYDEASWGKGIGTYSVRQYTTILFEKFPEIEHVGYTTWSGNIGMIKIGENLGFRLEKKIRKVRYYNGYYYDSIGYGILREEWMEN